MFSGLSVPLKNKDPSLEPQQQDNQEGLYHLKGDEDLADVLVQLRDDEE